MRNYPFVATHGVNENDNRMIWQTIECYDAVAERAKCALHLYHYTRKLGGEEASSESARGARAFVDAIRAVRVLETMTKEEAKKLNIENPGYYFSSFSGKRNCAPPASDSTWYRSENVELNNGGWLFGDDVGVVTSWTHPGAQDLDLTPERIIAVQREVAKVRWREDVRADMWVGKAVALALGLDAIDDRVKKVLKRLIRDQFLRFEPGKDENYHDRCFVVVGPGPGPSAPGPDSSGTDGFCAPLYRGRTD